MLLFLPCVLQAQVVSTSVAFATADEEEEPGGDIELLTDSNVKARFIAESEYITITNGYVSAWADFTANNVDLSQSTEANRPTFSESNGVMFDGSNDWLFDGDAGNLSVAVPMTIYIVLYQDSWTYNDEIFRINEYGFDGAAYGFQSYASPILAYTGGNQMFANENSNYDLNLDTWGVWVISINGASSTTYINNMTTDAGMETETRPATYLYLGGADGTQYANVYIKEFVLRGVADDLTTRTAIVDHLMDKYGIE